ncbi:MAG TPA: cyclic nucleotide-binding domain-containing protein [Thermoleophilaceae bacterium]|jgi:CRP-like cAMP-binding protein|nr:cyclic nucleotide-binding domain-containing protein [Thermoleophilaceae bacterium]
MDEARLREIPLFAGLGKKERREVAKQADEVDVQAGRHLVREGEFAYEFFAIEEGTADVRRGEQLLGELGPGDFFGEMGLIEKATRNASVIATTPIRALVLTGPAFRHLERELPAVSKQIRRAIDERCHQLEPLG